jgi:hypothetical protein
LGKFNFFKAFINFLLGAFLPTILNLIVAILFSITENEIVHSSLSIIIFSLSK